MKLNLATITPAISSPAITILLLIAAGGMLTGCDADRQQASSGQLKPSSSHVDSHPKLSFHQPDSFPAAIQRLLQIHKSLVGDGDFPEPVSFDYVEVIHGEGASGHSHFYAADEYDPNQDGHDDGFPGEHHEEHETVEHHSTTVDLRTELNDLVGWLPEIAAESDFKEADWNSVKTIAGRLTEIIDAMDPKSSDASFRESWIKESESVDDMLGKLQELSDSLEAGK